MLRAFDALRGSVDRIVAVVRPDARGAHVAALLRQAGSEIVACATADAGMGHSLACAATRVAAAGTLPSAVIVALGDMPFVRDETVARVVAAVHGPDAIAAPAFGGVRGHPVAFGAAHLPALGRLAGDRGAAELLRRYPVTIVEVDDAGVLRDIDTPGDLAEPLAGQRPAGESSS